MCLSIFFKRDKNLLTFLRRAICRDELRATKYEILQFLQRFITAADKKILSYAADIKDTCIAVFNSEKFADVRCSTISIIANIIEITSGNCEIAGQLNLAKLADEFFVSLVNQSKLPSSGKIFPIN